MKNVLSLVFTLACTLALQAQYYYKDIIGTRETNQMIRLYQQNKVLAVEATGFDGDGVKNSDFSETHNFYPDRQVLKIATRNKTTISNQFFRFNEGGLVTTISDTSASLISTTTYNFNEKNNPTLIKNTISDNQDSIYQKEEHQWFYDDRGRPTRMLRIINDRDTIDVRFTLDENGNVIEELPFIRKKSGEKIYYYYDPRNRLTDIVRFNAKARRLLPDYLFEYSDKNQVIQKITTLSSIGLSYLIWRYSYDDKGLKAKEATFNRDKVMTGKIEYSYRFSQ